MITLKAYGNLSALAGRKEFCFELSEPTPVTDAVRRFAELGGEPVQRFLFDQSDQLRPGIFVLVNNQFVNWHVPSWLADGDEIIVLPPVAGG